MLVTTPRFPILLLWIVVVLIPVTTRCQPNKRDVYDDALVSFMLPPTGQIVQLELNSGMCITGAFVRVHKGAVTLQDGDENISFPRHSLDEECREQYFARDYANSRVREVEEKDHSHRALETEKRKLNEETREHLIQLKKQLADHQKKAAVYVYMGDKGRRIDYLDGTDSALWRGSWFNPGDELYASLTPDDRLLFYAEDDSPRIIPATDFVPAENATETLRARLEDAEEDYRSSLSQLGRAEDRLAFLGDSVVPENIEKRISAKAEVRRLEKQASTQREIVENYRKGLERFLRTVRAKSN